MQKLTVVFFAIVISACSSVPLSTLFKLSSFDSSDIAAIKASELRVRLTLDDPMKLAKQSLRLQLKFEYADNSGDQFEFQLESSQSLEKLSSSGWFNAQTLRHRYEFKLTRVAQLEFSNFQQSLVKRKKIKKYFWTVFYYLAPHNQSDAKLDVELKTSKHDDYFYLLEGAKIKVESET